MTLQLVEPHVDLLNDEKLAELLAPRDGTCVSIYMPTHRSLPEREQDSIRLKNLLSEAEKQLNQYGLDQTEIETLLAPIQRYTQHEEQDFWHYQSDGLAILLTEDETHIYRLPRSFKAEVYVNAHFYIKPLLAVLDSEQHFYVLTLSQKNVRLLEGTRFELGEVELSSVSTNFEDWMDHGEFVGGLQFHSGGGSGNKPIYHGGNDFQNTQNQALREFLGKIENHVTRLLQTQQAPLILVGNERLQGTYRHINAYANLSTIGITTNPDILHDDELHEQAWAMIEPELSHAKAQALGLYAQLAAKSDKQALNDMNQIIPAAYFRRVDTLFVVRDMQIWGQFDVESQSVIIQDAPSVDSIELINWAVIHTLRNGGTVYHLHDMSSDEPLQAILRY